MVWKGSKKLLAVVGLICAPHLIRQLFVFISDVSSFNPAIICLMLSKGSRRRAGTLAGNLPQHGKKILIDQTILGDTSVTLKGLKRAGSPATVIAIHWTGVVAEIGQKLLCLSGVLGIGLLGSGVG